MEHAIIYVSIFPGGFVVPHVPRRWRQCTLNVGTLNVGTLNVGTLNVGNQ